VTVRAGGVSDATRVGIVLREQDVSAWRGRLGELTAAITAAGLDHVAVGDHISFADGHGVDGLTQAAALVAAHPTIRVQTAVYLLALRHPAAVARQLATISLLAPGRLVFGVGLGGDDRRELELCRIDPRTRGARMNEALECLRRLTAGEEASFRGRFFEFDRALIRPAPEPAIPVLVGGRSDAALGRVGRFGEGWVALWVSPCRFTAACEAIEAAAVSAGRGEREWEHVLQLWAGLAPTREAARRRVARAMEASYAMPFERFERYTPCGSPADVAAWLEPYVEAGCRCFNFVAEAGGLEEAIAAVAEVKKALAPQRTAMPPSTLRT
jgi:alkanesulfonate monooxygenase SsuD/methylene tetrahydromethanopterin reductase-like flavin-dependent oxidoreductase (luciferase family)